MQHFTVTDDEEIEDHIEVGDTYKIVSIDKVMEDGEKSVQVRFAKIKV